MGKTKKKILFLSIYDYAGSGHRYSKAVNRSGQYASSSLKFMPHKFGYPIDFCIMSKKEGLATFSANCVRNP